jgi:hypothetical protein
MVIPIVGPSDYLPVMANVATREDLVGELVNWALLWKITVLRINLFHEAISLGGKVQTRCRSRVLHA